MKRKTLLIILVSGLLITQFIFGLYLAKIDSQTTDESVHLSAGYTYLTKHDFRFNPEHPPLIKIIAASPLLLEKMKLPNDKLYFDKAGDFFYDSWREARNYGEDLLYSLGNDADFILLSARVPMLLVTLLLGLTIFVISSRLWGINGGILSLVLYILEPIILAHGHLVTTDIGAGLGYALTVYLLWLFLNKPNWKRTLLLSAALGISLLIKFTMVILVPAIVILFIYFWIAKRVDFKSALKMIGKLVIVALVAFLIIWGGYFFKTDRIPQDTNSQAVSVLRSNKVIRFVNPILVPRDYYKGLAIITTHIKYGHDSFLLGQKSRVGWWYYFPVVFSAKTTIPLFVIVVLSVLIIFLSRKRRKKGIFFLIAALIFLGFAMLSKADLGARHLMPFYIVLIIIAGISAEFFRRTAWRQWLLIFLVAWLLFENYKVFPYYLSYYNEFYRGTQNGYKVATDSNYDWGQDLKRIKGFLSNHPEISKPYVEYGWDSEKALDYYQIERRPLGEYALNQTGYLIIGATALNDPVYNKLDKSKLYGRISPSVFVYKLDK
jgi:4-amino-4-deoxy-L-arabinose transferase-like glycosyltransferase